MSDRTGRRMQMRRERGFTLVELLIVVVVVALLAAIAVPTYTDQVRKGNRAAAKGFLTELMARQESYLGDRKTYAATLSALGYGADTVYLDRDGKPQTTDNSERIYSVTVCTAGPDCAAPTATLVKFQATPIHGQAGDKCNVLKLGTDGSRYATGTAGVSGCWKR